jgi:hypothetical protein
MPSEEWFSSIQKRVEALEQLSYSVAMARAETIARLWESDPHQFSSRPCSTCKAITGVLGRKFGCATRER